MVCKRLQLNLLGLLLLVFYWQCAYLRGEIYEVRLVDDTTGFVQDIESIRSHAWALDWHIGYYVPRIFNLNQSMSNSLLNSLISLSTITNQNNSLYRLLQDRLDATYEELVYIGEDIDMIHSNLLPSIYNYVSNSYMGDLNWRQSLGWKSGLEYLASLLTNFFLYNTLNVFVQGGYVSVDGGWINANVDWPSDTFTDTNIYEVMDIDTKNLSSVGRVSALEGFNNINNNIFDEHPQGAVPSDGSIRFWGHWTRLRGEELEEIKNRFSNWQLSQSENLYLGTVHVSGQSIPINLSWSSLSLYIPFIRALLLFLNVICAGVLVLRFTSGVLTTN